MTNKQLEVERCKITLAECRLELVYARKKREAKSAELRAAFDREIMDLDRGVEEKELSLQRHELYLKHAEAEAARGFEA